MKLNTQTFPESANFEALSEPPIVIIPGLFGSIANWRSFAKTLSADFPVIVVDQRNHGQSPHADSNDYFDLASDLLELLDDYGLDQVHLCGHSMGGKTAMSFSLLYPERVSSLVVLDIAPVRYSHSHAPFLEELLKVDLSAINSRNEADRALREVIPDVSTRLFLLQNLTGKAKNYSWRINIEVLHREMETIVSFPFKELADRQNSIKTLILIGGQSDYVRPEHHKGVKNFFPNAVFEEIANAGHWIHVEQPLAVITSLTNFLKRDKK